VYSHRNFQSAEIALLDKLPRAKGAQWDHVDCSACLAGTRTEELNKFKHWTINETERRVYLLTGLAGTGKTTIAKSVAEFAHGDHILGASFFCSRDSDERSNIRHIFPTVAFQLSQFSPPFRAGVITAIKAKPDIGYSLPDEQLNGLIVEPRRRIITSLKKSLGIDPSLRDEELAEAILERIRLVVAGVKEKFCNFPDKELKLVEGSMISSILDVLRTNSTPSVMGALGNSLLNTISKERIEEFVRRELRVTLQLYHSIPDEQLKKWIVDPSLSAKTMPFKEKLGMTDPRPDNEYRKLVVKLTRAVVVSVKKKLGIVDSMQLKELFVTPLRLKPLLIPVVVVIDALDECKDEDTAEKILLALSRHIPSMYLQSIDSMHSSTTYPQQLLTPPAKCRMPLHTVKYVFNSTISPQQE